MTGINGLSSGLSSITNGYSASQSASLQNEMSKFQNLLDTLMNKEENSPSENLSKTETASEICSIKSA